MANGWVEVDQARRHIERAGERARTLAPNLGGGYFLQSTLLAFVDLNWAEALSMAERAVALEPVNPEVLRRYAYITNVIGRHDEAIDAAKQALEIDPGLSDNRLELGVDYLWARRYPEAETVFRELIARDPEYPRARYNLGVCRYVQGDPAGALALFEQEPLDWMRRTGRSLALHALGRRQEADAAFDEFIRIDGTSASYQQAQVAAQRGDPDLAFKLLEKALEVRDLGVSRVLIDPLLDPIRADPRFRKVVEREGLLPFMDKDAAAKT